MPTTRKPYFSARRQEMAATTKRRLTESARRLFGHKGYAATTIAEIADDAGLAVQTFYAVFGSKRAVLSSLIDEMELNAELPQLLHQLRSTTDSHEQLAAIVDFNLRLFGRGAGVLDIVRTAVTAEPDLADAHREGEARRRRDQKRIVHGWARHHALRDGLRESEAGDVLWAMTSPEVYRLFVIENGWAQQQFGDWLLLLLTKLLLRQPARSR